MTAVRTLALTALVLSAWSGPANAAVFTFTGAAGQTDWFAASNWNSGAAANPPGVADSVVIPAGAVVHLASLLPVSVAVQSVQVSSGAVLTVSGVTLEARGAGCVTVQSTAVLNVGAEGVDTTVVCSSTSTAPVPSLSVTGTLIFHAPLGTQVRVDIQAGSLAVPAAGTLSTATGGGVVKVAARSFSIHGGVNLSGADIEFTGLQTNAPFVLGNGTFVVASTEVLRLAGNISVNAVPPAGEVRLAFVGSGNTLRKSAGGLVPSGADITVESAPGGTRLALGGTGTLDVNGTLRLLAAAAAGDAPVLQGPIGSTLRVAGQLLVEGAVDGFAALEGSPLQPLAGGEVTVGAGRTFRLQALPLNLAAGTVNVSEGATLELRSPGAELNWTGGTLVQGLGATLAMSAAAFREVRSTPRLSFRVSGDGEGNAARILTRTGGLPVPVLEHHDVTVVGGAGGLGVLMATVPVTLGPDGITSLNSVGPTRAVISAPSCTVLGTLNTHSDTFGAPASLDCNITVESTASVNVEGVFGSTLQTGPPVHTLSGLWAGVAFQPWKVELHGLVVLDGPAVGLGGTLSQGVNASLQVLATPMAVDAQPLVVQPTGSLTLVAPSAGAPARLGPGVILQLASAFGSAVSLSSAGAMTLDAAWVEVPLSGAGAVVTLGPTACAGDMTVSTLLNVFPVENPAKAVLPCPTLVDAAGTVRTSSTLEFRHLILSGGALEDLAPQANWTHPSATSVLEYRSGTLPQPLRGRRGAVLDLRNVDARAPGHVVEMAGADLGMRGNLPLGWTVTVAAPSGSSSVTLSAAGVTQPQRIRGELVLNAGTNATLNVLAQQALWVEQRLVTSGPGVVSFGAASDPLLRVPAPGVVEQGATTVFARADHVVAVEGRWQSLGPAVTVSRMEIKPTGQHELALPSVALNTLVGDYALESGALLTVGVEGSQTSRLDVTGAVSLEGWVVLGGTLSLMPGTVRALVLGNTVTPPMPLILGLPPVMDETQEWLVRVTPASGTPQQFEIVFAAASVVAHYLVFSDRVRDTQTGLVWANAELASTTWASAIASGCGELSPPAIGGSWRLPTIRELSTLVDYGDLTPPMVRAGAVQVAGAGGPMWSSTPNPRSSGFNEVLLLDTSTGEGTSQPPDVPARVLCVLNTL